MIRAVGGTACGGPAQPSASPDERCCGRPHPPFRRGNSHARRLRLRLRHVSSEADQAPCLVDNGEMSEAATAADAAGTRRQRAGLARSGAGPAWPCRFIHRIPAGWRRACASPRPALAGADPDLHARRPDRVGCPSRPCAAARHLRDGARRLAHRTRDHHARGEAVGHPARAEPARRAGAPRRPGERAGRDRCARRGGPRSVVVGDSRTGCGLRLAGRSGSRS